MQWKQLLLLVILILLIPITGFAFSWKSLIWWKKPAEPVEKIKVLSQQERLTAQEKFNNWDKAFKNKSWDPLLKNETENLTISEEEINYMVTKELLEESNPPVKNLTIRFRNDKITLSGYLLKPLEGNFTSDFVVTTKDKKVELEATKVRFKGIPFPKSLSNKLLSKALEPVKTFLYSHPNYEGMEVTTKDGQLKIQYK